ncbi:MAG: precorrin-3B C(17)-methyltransferase [Methanoregulaceae archaeon]|nr:precorrin-3B C(17)-methyltransferase [Methanoregulaceae archaeon]
MPSHGENGCLSIVGTGPGRLDQMTARAAEVIREADCVIGNESYLSWLAPLIHGKEVIRSRMGREVERAETAVRLAADRRVAIVSGGDAGVYGMASIVLEIVERNEEKIRVEVVPGITAANAAAALLGSPLSGDFAVISLSDLLTPIDTIGKRLEAVFSVGIPVALYNPRSRGRPHNLALALEIASRHLGPDTPVGIVKNAYRDGEVVSITTLGKAGRIIEDVDMHSILIIGGEESRIWRNGTDARGIITPRGYHRKYVY